MRLPQNGQAFAADAVPRDRDQAIAVLRRAVELGVNHIDTAAFHFSRPRSANELINRALAPHPDDLVIATKVGPARDPGGDWLPLARPEQLRGQPAPARPRPPGRGQPARVAGVIRHLGISNARPAHLAQAQAIAPVVCVQNAYGLGYRREQDAFVDTCGEQGIAFVPFFSQSPAPDARRAPAATSTRRCSPPPGRTGRARRRCGSRRRCGGDRTCWSSPVPGPLVIWRTTAPPAVFGSRRTSSSASTPCTGRHRRGEPNQRARWSSRSRWSSPTQAT
ncbi:aldo/keto reductase [Amycolatopsis sp. NPDC004747]